VICPRLTSLVESVFSVPASRSNKTESSWGGSVSEMSSSRHYYERSTPTNQPPQEKEYYRASDTNTFYEDPNSLSTLMKDANISARKGLDSDFAINHRSVDRIIPLN